MSLLDKLEWHAYPGASGRGQQDEICWLPTVIHSPLIPQELRWEGWFPRRNSRCCYQMNGWRPFSGQMPLMLWQCPSLALWYSPLQTCSSSELQEQPPLCLLVIPAFFTPLEPSPTSHTWKRKWKSAFLCEQTPIKHLQDWQCPCLSLQAVNLPPSLSRQKDQYSEHMWPSKANWANISISANFCL